MSRVDGLILPACGLVAGLRLVPMQSTIPCLGLVAGESAVDVGLVGLGTVEDWFLSSLISSLVSIAAPASKAPRPQFLETTFLDAQVPNLKLLKLFEHESHTLVSFGESVRKS